MVDTIPYYIQQLFNLLLSPAGMVLLLLAGVAVFCTVVVPSMRWVILAVLLYTTTFGVAAGSDPRSHSDNPWLVPLAFPLSLIQSNARAFTVLCDLMLLIPTILSARGYRVRLVSGAMLAFFLLEMWFSVRLMLDSTLAARAVLEITVFCTTLITLGFGLSRWLQTPEDVRALVKTVVSFGALLVLGTIYQIIMVPATAHAPRLSGTTDNPQFLGTACALTLPAAVFLIQDRRTGRLWRYISIPVAAFLIVFLIWSGSRTAFLMAVCSVCCVFGVRIHRMILPAIGIGLVLWIVPLFFPDAFAGISRFTDTSNDRAGAWSGLFDTFLHNPVIGATSYGLNTRESFVLSTLAFYGAVGGVLLAISGGFIFLGLLNLIRRRRFLGPDAPLANLVIANFVALGIEAFFEAALLGSLNVATFLLYINFALFAFLRDRELLVAHQQTDALWYAETEFPQDMLIA